MADLADLPRRMPALLVSVGNLAIEVRNRVDIGRVDLDVALCTRHLRGTGRASRNPGPGVPGLFQLMEQVENILNGRRNRTRMVGLPVDGPFKNGIKTPTSPSACTWKNSRHPRH